MRTLSCGRRAPRKSVDLTCRLKLREGRSRRGRILDLSTHGAWLRTTKPLDDGARLHVSVTLPNGEELALHGEVMWSLDKGRRAGMAVEWLGLDGPERQRIARALDGLPDASGAPTRFAYADVG